MQKHTCEHCGSKFTRKTDRRKSFRFCGLPCAYAARSAKSERRHKHRTGVQWWVLFPDIHFPDHDPLSLMTCFNLVEDIQPAGVAQLGDIANFDAFSHFPKSVNLLTRMPEELATAKTFWPEIKRRSPKSKRVQLFGNHEVRFDKWLVMHPEVAGLVGMSVREMLDLDGHGVESHPYGDLVPICHDVAITHGERIGKYGAYSANSELLSRWRSGVSGHTHRLGQTYLTSAAGSFHWTEAGYLGSTDWKRFGYVRSQPNWQQGIVVVAVLQGRPSVVTPIPIHDHTLLFNGTLYTPRRRPVA